MFGWQDDFEDSVPSWCVEIKTHLQGDPQFQEQQMLSHARIVIFVQTDLRRRLQHVVYTKKCIRSLKYLAIWTASSEIGTYSLCEQRRFRRACASAQSRQNLRCSLISSESRETFRQKARYLAPLNGWACAVKICHEGMLEDTNSLEGAHLCYDS